MTPAKLVFLAVCCALSAQASDALVFHGYARVPWLKQPGTSLSRTLEAASQHGWWSQLSAATRHDMARAKQPGGGVYFGSFQVAAVQRSDREVQLVELHREELDPPKGSGPYMVQPRIVRVTVRYAVSPTASERPRNVLVLRFRRSVQVRFERVAWTPTTLPASSSLSDALGNGADGVVPGDLAFEVCHGADCRFRAPVRLSTSDWARVRALFPQPSKDPAEERSRVRATIALLEQLTGPQAGTADDRGGWAGNVKDFGPGQQDCLDETANTTTYLGLLLRDGLLRFHRPEAHQLRGGTHFATSMRDMQSGGLWVVDAWVRDNGQPPAVQTLADWRSKQPD